MRIATFNAYNLNAPNHRFVGRSNARHFTENRFAQQKANLVAVLETVVADVVGFQEVFSEDALREVVEASPMRGGSRGTGSPSHRGRGDGWISRIRRADGWIG